MYGLGISFAQEHLLNSCWDVGTTQELLLAATELLELELFELLELLLELELFELLELLLELELFELLELLELLLELELFELLELLLEPHNVSAPGFNV